MSSKFRPLCQYNYAVVKWSNLSQQWPGEWSAMGSKSLIDDCNDGINVIQRNYLDSIINISEIIVDSDDINVHNLIYI